MSDMEQSADVQNSDAEVADSSNESEQVIGNETDQSSDADSAEQSTDEEMEEIEVDGVKFDMPKAQAEKLKAERMMHADYTRKTQEAAEMRKAIEAEREQYQQRVAADQQDFTDRAKLHQINETLQQYGQVDWQAAYDQDPIAAGKAQAQIQQLTNERSRLEGSIAQNQQRRALDEQQSTAKQVQDAEAYVAREIPGWTEQRGEEIKKFAAAQGFDLNPETARMLIKNPALFKIMHKAALFDQLEKKQVAKPAAPAVPVKPVTRIGAKSPSGQVDPNKMSADQWREWREQELAKKHKR